MRLFSFRFTFFLSFIIASVLLIFAWYLQTYAGVAPCPLCILQRFVFMLLGLIFLFGAIFNFKKNGKFFISFLSFVITGFGAALAGRQVWLQHLPPGQNSNCGASLEYMLQVFPLKQVLLKIFMGSSECSLVDWQFLGLSVAGWSLVWFCFFLLIAIRQFFLSLDK